MIDAHVHAFPSLSSLTEDALQQYAGDQVAAVAKTQIIPRLSKAGRVLGGRFKRLIPDGSELRIEKVARLKSNLPKRVSQWVESISSLAMGPSVIANGGLNTLLASMDRSNIERVILIGSAGVASNQWLLHTAKPECGERVIPVVTLPELEATQSVSAWGDEYRRLAHDGARGFKIHTNWDGLSVDHPGIEAAFHVASELDRFIILHTGCFHAAGYKHTNPVRLKDFEGFFETFPNVRVCLAHMNREHPQQAWEVMKRFPQVFTDTSWQTRSSIRAALNTVGSERICVGSDFPLLHRDLMQDAQDLARRAATDCEFEDISARSALRFIGEA